MTPLLRKIVGAQHLTSSEASELMGMILREEVNSHQVASLLGVLESRGVAAEELVGFCDALDAASVKVDLGETDLIDVCGTGGDHKDTFNISTTVAFVLAGAGSKVAKHGNYSVSSRCGSSNVLEALGIRFHTSQDELRADLKKAGVCFMHAPLFHPALKVVSDVRRALGHRTVFNVLGPLVNPAAPGCQIAGVYDADLLQLYGCVLPRRRPRYGAIFTLDGYDEISLTAPAKVITHRGEALLQPDDFGLKGLNASDLQLDSQPQSSGIEVVARGAAVIRAIVEGRGTPAQEQVVVANAGFCLWVQGVGEDLRSCVDRARTSIRSGAAAQSLASLITT